MAAIIAMLILTGTFAYAVFRILHSSPRTHPRRGPSLRITIRRKTVRIVPPAQGAAEAVRKKSGNPHP